MTKTTYVMRGGQLVEKPKALAPMVEMLELGEPHAEWQERVREFQRQVDRDLFTAFTGIRLD